MIATTRRFVERTNSAVRIDRNAGVIYDVQVLAEDSRNGRRYTRRAMEQAVPKYNGKKVFLNHPKRDELGEDRPFESWVGIVENARFRNGAIRADIRLRTKSPHYEEVLEAAEQFNHCFGCSHVAEGESYMDGETEIVESIREIHSVDIVTSPATNSGLFESMTFQRETQQEIDSLVKEVERFADTATQLLQVALDRDDPSITTDAANVARTLGDTLTEWINSDGSGTANGEAVREYANRIINSIVETLGDPLAPESRAQLEASLKDLREFVSGLRDGRDSLIDDAASNRDIGPGTDEPALESYRGDTRQAGEEFLPLVPRHYPDNALASFAHRMR
jgi:hypothetical protein